MFKFSQKNEDTCVQLECVSSILFSNFPNYRQKKEDILHQQLTLGHIPNKQIAETDNVVTGVRTPGTLLRDAVHRVPQGNPRGDQDANNCTTVPLSLTPDNFSRFAILPSIPRDREGSTHCLGIVKMTVWGPGSLSPLRRGYLKLAKVFRFWR